MASSHRKGQPQYQIANQQTLPLPTVSPTPANPAPAPARPKQSTRRIAAIAIVLGLAVALYFTWHTAPATPQAPAMTQQNFSNNSSSSTPNANTSSGGTIEVYVVGAVKHPGLYTLPAGARVYDLLQAAGGPLPNANLVALNLAAKLSDGQEVYVTMIGETPPTYAGGVPGVNGNSGDQLVNINTATADDMRQKLHISGTTAQSIVNYRQQHGNFTSVDQLLQVVSKTIYDRIKSMVTV